MKCKDCKKTLFANWLLKILASKERKEDLHYMESLDYCDECYDKMVGPFHEKIKEMNDNFYETWLGFVEQRFGYVARDFTKLITGIDEYLEKKEVFGKMRDREPWIRYDTCCSIQYGSNFMNPDVFRKKIFDDLVKVKEQMMHTPENQRKKMEEAFFSSIQEKIKELKDLQTRSIKSLEFKIIFFFELERFVNYSLGPMDFPDVTKFKLYEKESLQVKDSDLALVKEITGIQVEPPIKVEEIEIVEVKA